MSTEETLLEMKRQVENATRTHDQATGALAQIEKQIKDDFGASSLEEAEKLLDELDAEAGRLLTEENQLLEEIKQAYPWEGI